MHGLPLTSHWLIEYDVLLTGGTTNVPFLKMSSIERVSSAKQTYPGFAAPKMKNWRETDVRISDKLTRMKSMI